ncbi:MAG: hypothetical protein QF809_03565 [Candidatus Peribacteraceae bacterium]|jgi:hypothetical protein|nr:hypothetical protein [Candidatus Peribacteraceae bacterium]
MGFTVITDEMVNLGDPEANRDVISGLDKVSSGELTGDGAIGVIQSAMRILGRDAIVGEINVQALAGTLSVEVQRKHATVQSILKSMATEDLLLE